MSMVLKLIKINVLSAFICCLAQAAEDKVSDNGFPAYNVDNKCHTLGYLGAPTNDPSIIRIRTLKTNQCIEDEQIAYETAKSQWTSLTEEHRNYCLKAANNAPYKNYWLLGSCVANYYEKMDGHQTPKKFHP
jgi:hypothetical protein